MKIRLYWKWWVSLSVLYLLWSLSSMLLQKESTTITSTQRTFPQNPNSTFIHALKQIKLVDNTIILALVDYGFIDMAVNFYETSLKPFHIENYLFVGASNKTCEELVVQRLPCFTYTEDISGDIASLYRSADFLRKMNIRTDMILEAMSIGITVVHTDLDVVFLRNPLPELSAQEGDLAALWDKSAHNAGFLIVRPTKHGISIYNRVKAITTASNKTDDQVALNMAIQKCNHGKNKCKVTSLSTSTYLCGFSYFEKGRRMFAGQNPCADCTVVHNNWIVSKEAKVYRFKENHLWWNDQDDYYSSDTRKYLFFSNPLLNEKSTNMTELLKLEKHALQNALSIGYILSRIVILPRFHCFDAKIVQCPLNALYKVLSFDTMFVSFYRESTFLNHPLVPKSVTSSRTATYRIQTGRNYTDIAHDTSSEPIIVRTPGGVGGATPGEITKWFDHLPENVLVFEHMHEAFVGFGEENPELQRKLQEAFEPSDYRQLQTIPGIKGNNKSHKKKTQKRKKRRTSYIRRSA